VEIIAIFIALRLIATLCPRPSVHAAQIVLQAECGDLRSHFSLTHKWSGALF
jgi:hypothetical protein